VTIDELEEFATIINGIDVPPEVLSANVNTNEIHLPAKYFFELFHTFDTHFEGGMYRYRVSAKVGGVTVFCLSNRDLERWEDYV